MPNVAAIEKRNDDTASDLPRTYLPTSWFSASKRSAAASSTRMPLRLLDAKLLSSSSAAVPGIANRVGQVGRAPRPAIDSARISVLPVRIKDHTIARYTNLLH
jgi:hypothetical protein